MVGPKTVSEKQLAANHANAQKSTGPRTPEGKYRSRWNALTHGVLSQAIIPFSLEPYESRKDFDKLLTVLFEEFNPNSAIEGILVERIAVSYWRLARLVRAEAATIASRQESLVYDQAKDSEFGAFFRARLRMPFLNEQGKALSEAMDMNDRPQLRRLMTKDHPDLLQANDEQILAAAEGLVTEIVEKLSVQQKYLDDIERDERSIPHLADAFQFARYETALERQLYRALDALERLQRQRRGEYVPPPLNVNLDTSFTDSNPDAPTREE